jgi:hypothetical protein
LSRLLVRRQIVRKKIKSIIIQSFCGIVFAGVVYLIVGSLVISGVIVFTLLLLVMTQPVILVLNKLTQRTNWYKNQLAEGTKFLKQIPFDLDICNLGSNSGKFAFSYDDVGLKGENWAIGPQTLSYDFRLLKNYFSYLKEGATVLIPLCPFSGCIKDFEDDTMNHKYYSFLHPILILNYSQDAKEDVMRFVNTPFQFSPLAAIKRLIKDVPAIDSILLLSNNPMDEASLEKDANKWINNWKQQFSIIDLDDLVSEQNKECVAYNTNLLKDIVFFCSERSLKPVIVIPPVTNMLSSKFSERFCDSYIYSLIGKLDTTQVTFLNYFDDGRFSEPDLYFNSYFLNARGRTLFTKTVLKDLRLIK